MHPYAQYIPVDENPFRSPASGASNSATLGEVFKLVQYDGHCSAPTTIAQFPRHRVCAGKAVLTIGQECGGLHVVRFGALKTVITLIDGSEHIVAFSLAGDLFGIEGTASPRYRCETVALTDCEVIRLPVKPFFSPERKNDGIESMLFWAVSREVSRRQAYLGVRHAIKSDVRIARFLSALCDSHAARGMSALYLRLPMTRCDIASYLSITVGSVSRALLALSNAGIIAVSNRDIRIKDLKALMEYEG